MSERFIFNKKLNRNRHQKWYWLALSVLVISAGSSVWAKASAQDVELLDPSAEFQSVFSSTLTSIDFTRGQQGTGIATVGFDNPSSNPRLIEAQGKITVTLPSTQLADDQFVKINVNEFGTPISSIETFQDEADARIVLEYDGQVTARLNNEDGDLSIQISPLTAEQAAELESASEYTGKPISLDFQDVPVRQVLQIIAQVNGFNLVTTDTVTGNVTISLSAVPWDQALDMILKIKGLDKRLEGNILLIAPSEELTARETQQLQSQQQVQNLAPLKNASITVNYAKAEALALILKNGDGGILSSRGTVTVDERTNTLLVRDSQESIDEARSVVGS